MIDPYLFDNHGIFDKIPFENKQKFDYSSDYLNLTNFIKDFNVYNNQNTDQDLNCFTTDQLQKIQNENFATIDKNDDGLNQFTQNKIITFVCRNCKVKEKNYKLFGQFCSETCRQIFTKKKNELMLKKEHIKLASKKKKKLVANQKKTSHMDVSEKSPLTNTSNHQQFTKQNNISLPPNPPKDIENKNKYYIPKTHCPTIGCNGIGHINGKFTSHHSSSGCPYSEQNQKLSFNTEKREIPKIVIKKIGDSLFASKKFNLEKKIALINQKKAKKLHKKRGRPVNSKNKLKPSSQLKISPKDTANSDENLAQESNILQEKFVNDKREKEIKESVYLASLNEQGERSYEKPGFKYDSQLLVGINEYLKNVTTNFRSWCVKDVSDFIKSIPGCSELAYLFELQEIDGEALMLIQEADLISLMNIKLGPAVKIFNYVLKLKQISEQFHGNRVVNAFNNDNNNTMFV